MIIQVLVSFDQNNPSENETRRVIHQAANACKDFFSDDEFQSTVWLREGVSLTIAKIWAAYTAFQSAAKKLHSTLAAITPEDPSRAILIQKQDDINAALNGIKAVLDTAQRLERKLNRDDMINAGMTKQKLIEALMVMKKTVEADGLTEAEAHKAADFLLLGFINDPEIQTAFQKVARCYSDTDYLLLQWLEKRKINNL